MIYSYPKLVRLRTRRQFQRMAHQSTRHVGNWMIIDARQNNNSLTKLGITATKRYGKSTIRNRFKRIVREAFRLCRHKLKAGVDLHVKPRNLAHSAKMQDVLGEFIQFFGQS